MSSAMVKVRGSMSLTSGSLRILRTVGTSAAPKQSEDWYY